MKDPFPRECQYSDYVSEMAQIRLEDGTAFSDFTNGDLDIESTDPINGAILYDSGRFNASAEMDKWVWYHNTTAGNQVTINPSEYFVMYRPFFSPRYYWGEPLAYGSEFFAEKFLRLITTRVDTHSRIGNPNGFTIMSVDPEQMERAGTINGQQAKDLFFTQMAALKTQQKKATEHNYRTGKASNMIASFPHGVDISSYNQAKDMKGLTEYVPEFNAYAMQLGAMTGAPVSFLGVTVPAGMNSDRHKQEMELLRQTAAQEQRKLRGPADQGLKLFLQGVDGVDSRLITDFNNQIKAEWITPSLEDEKLMAETGKLEAEAYAQHILNFQNIQGEFSQDGQGAERANAYLEANGLGDLVI